LTILFFILAVSHRNCASKAQELTDKLPNYFSSFNPNLPWTSIF